MPKCVIFILNFILLFCNFFTLSNVWSLPHPIPPFQLFFVFFLCVSMLVFDEKKLVTYNFTGPFCVIIIHNGGC